SRAPPALTGSRSSRRPPPRSKRPSHRVSVAPPFSRAPRSSRTSVGGPARPDVFGLRDRRACQGTPVRGGGDWHMRPVKSIDHPRLSARPALAAMRPHNALLAPPRLVALREPLVRARRGGRVRG